MHYLIILHYFIIILGETLRNLCTLIELCTWCLQHMSMHHSVSCHVDNTVIRTPHLAHVVYTTDLRATPL